MKKTAIVTGAHGYIGSVLTKILNEEGWRVYGIDNEPKYTWDRYKYCDDVVLNDFTSLAAEYLYKYHPDATIFHLAANSLLGPSATEPLRYFNNNTAKTLQLLTHLQKSQRLIFASTAAVYAPSDIPVREDDKLEPPNNYGLSKLMTEQMLDKVCPVEGWKAVSFRFFNVIGAYGDQGQLPYTPHIINKLCQAALCCQPFTINGTDFPTYDGTCVRDYVHVVDICRAMIHADEWLRGLDTPGHHSYNLGTCDGLSVLDIVNEFNDKIGLPLTVEEGPRRVGDPPLLIADPFKFTQTTGFEYKYGPEDLPQMIEDAFKYARKVY